ncbi:MAG: alpha-L-fucosidase precursor [Bacteroidetes bacterium]|nr:alpha-L-fucosidase precursor [Bacteroidota bacterium]
MHSKNLTLKPSLLSLILVLSLGSLVLSGCQPKVEVPSYLHDYSEQYVDSPRAANLAWFQEAEFGLFLHYGLYAQLGMGEWVQLRQKIPVAEYAQLVDSFTAATFSPEQITETAISAGMKYITITSKHHDGFCLFKTNATDFNSINSPAGRDLIGELYEACEQKGLGLFLYYSYGADWKHPYFMSREDGWNNARPAYPEPQPEYKYEKPADFQIYIDFVHQQLTELLTQYPNIAGIWFDPIMGVYASHDKFPIDSTYALVRSLSPHALISFKQGANGDEDFMAPERSGKARVGKQFEISKIVYDKNKNKPREICTPLQPHAWGYNKSDDGKHRTPDEVMKMLADAKALNANLLLNIGPLPDGALPEEDIKTLIEVGKRRK